MPAPPFTNHSAKAKKPRALGTPELQWLKPNRNYEAQIEGMNACSTFRLEAHS